MKRRLSASVDDELLAAAERAVAEGRAPSMSALVEEALAARVAEDRRREAQREFLDWADEEWGALDSDQEAAADAAIAARTIRVRDGAILGEGAA